MVDRSTAMSSPGELGSADVLNGISEELSAELAVIDVGERHDVDAALAAAAEEHLQEWAEFAARVTDQARRYIVVGTELALLEPGSEVVIGRRADLVVDHPLVSRRHVAVTCTAGTVSARDLGSVNGSWLLRGDERLALTSEATDLVASDRIVTADDVELLHVPGAS